MGAELRAFVRKHKLAWVAGRTQNRVVPIYCSVTDIPRLGEDDMLQGEGLLVGFEFPVAEIFAD